MSHTHTIDDIWELFQETNRLFQESKRETELAAERRQQESERRQQESERRQQEAERRQQEAEQAAVRRRQDFEREMEERRADTERRIQETNCKLLESSQETNRKLLESSQETNRKIKEVSTLVGNLGGRWGEFVEGLVAPACIALFSERQIPVDEIYPRVKKTIAGERLEIDLLVANTVAAVLVEVKSNLTVEDVRAHLNRLAKFKSFFPRYASCQVYGAVAGIAIDAGADRFAMNQGFYVIVQSGDTVRLANDEAFTPRTW